MLRGRNRYPQVSLIAQLCIKVMYIHSKTISDTWGQLGTAGDGCGHLAFHLDTWRSAIYWILDMALEFS